MPSTIPAATVRKRPRLDADRADILDHESVVRRESIRDEVARFILGFRKNIAPLNVCPVIVEIIVTPVFFYQSSHFAIVDSYFKDLMAVVRVL